MHEGQWIIGYEDASEAQIYAARALVGLYEPRGILPIKIAGYDASTVRVNAADCPV